MTSLKQKRFYFILYVFLGLLLVYPSTVIGQDDTKLELKGMFEKGNEKSCIACHHERNTNFNSGILSERAFCLDCHTQKNCTRKVKGNNVSLQVTKKDFVGDYHQHVACTQCHDDVANTPHISQNGAHCQACHPVHNGDQAGAPHLSVRCESCHLNYQKVKISEDKDEIILANRGSNNKPLGLTDHSFSYVFKEKMCQKCHTSGNKVGAPSSVLPSKSILCITCHNSPASINSAYGLYWGPLVIAIIGIISIFVFWFSGYIVRDDPSLHTKMVHVGRSLWENIFSRNIFRILKVLLLDIILQRRILLQGVQRWSIHSLIFHAFLARMVISLIGLVAYTISAQSQLAMALIDKNHPFVAFTYDLLGVFILLGVIWAFIQRFIVKPEHMRSEEQDIISLAIIGSLVIVGFLLESSRLLMSAVTIDTSAFSFMGYILSGIMDPLTVNWQEAFVWFWYAHVTLWAIFIAYLPFGKLRHIIFTPLNLLFNLASKEEKG